MRLTRPVLLLACVGPLAAAIPVQAADFRLGDIEGSFITNVSLGATWRAEDADEDFLSPGNTEGRGRASSSTADDGNLNYDQGDIYSLQVRGLHDLQLTRDNVGFFSRLKWWYDYALDERDVDHGHVPNGYEPNAELQMGDFQDLAQESGIEPLDYYLFWSTDVGSTPVELRAGNMVLSWGESTFIQNGVNIINPFDVTALRKPGSEIKEALLPTGLVYANVGLTVNLSLEMFYQYQWDPTVLDECGTYWNAADVFGGGCDKLTVSAADPDREQIETDNFLPRAPTDNPSSTGQWGINARYFLEQLNGTEVGLYYINYHSRTPIFSGITPSENFGQPFLFGSNPAYFFEYPEDIEVFAGTFATNLGFWALSGEVSHRPDFPLQINTTDIAQAMALGSFGEWSRMLPRYQAAGPGARLQGYDNVEYTQAQFTLIRFFEQVLGADRLSFAAEVGAVWLDGMDGSLNYGRSPTFGVGDFEPFDSEVFSGVRVGCNSHTALSALAGVVPNSQAQNCTDDGFTDDFSWGYRVRSSLEFSNVLAGVNLTPNIAWSHDVDGNSPPPNFIKDRMALSLGVSGDYLNRYRGELSYTTFFGADYNELEDRDFISLSFSVSF